MALLRGSTDAQCTPLWVDSGLIEYKDGEEGGGLLTLGYFSKETYLGTNGREMQLFGT